MRGHIQIPEAEVQGNKMGWNAGQLFNDKVARLSDCASAGWYAYRFDGIAHHFLWEDGITIRTSEKYLQALREDGWKTQ